MAEAEKKCPKCQEKVKLLASVCRHCGYEFTAAELEASRKLQATNSKVGLGCALVAIIVLLVAFLGKPETKTAPSSSQTNEVPSKAGEESSASSESSPYADETKQYAWISVGEEQIKKLLKDPDSATFQDVHFYSGGGVPVTCGEVNAKNGFGGYTGYERFVAAGTLIAATESMVEGGIGPVWDKYCVKAPTDRA